MKITTKTVEFGVERRDGQCNIAADEKNLMDDVNGDAIIRELCPKHFEAITGIKMKDGEKAMIRLEVVSADVIKKPVQYKREKVKIT